LNAIALRRDPTPGSTTATCTVPIGKLRQALSRRKAPWSTAKGRTPWVMSTSDAFGLTARIAPFMAPTYASSRPKSVSRVTIPFGFMPPCYLLACAQKKRAARVGGLSVAWPCGLVIRHRRRRRRLLLLGDVRDERLGGQQHRGDARRVLQRRTGDFRRVHDAGLQHVGVLALGSVEALALRQFPDLCHHDRAFVAGVVDDLAQRLLERAAD